MRLNNTNKYKKFRKRALNIQYLLHADNQDILFIEQYICMSHSAL